MRLVKLGLGGRGNIGSSVFSQYRVAHGVQENASGENVHKSTSCVPHVERKEEQENNKHNMWAQ